MLALSVKQPWAELIAQGKKRKEYRTWTRACFGELLIVASKSVARDVIAAEGLDVAELVFGRAVCVVDFYKVTGDEGEYAWHLRNPRRVEPIDVKGSASLYHVPDERIRIARAKDVTASPGRPIAKRVPPEPSSKAVRVPPRRRGRVRSPSPPALIEPEKRPAAPACPSCGATTSIPIEYGYPGPEMWEAHDRGEIELGGCVIVHGGDPAWRCRGCGRLRQRRGP